MKLDDSHLGASCERTVRWHDPAQARRTTEGWTGLQIMQAIRDGKVAPPPIAQLLGFECIVAEKGEVAMRLAYDRSLENSIAMLHGGVAATMLDTAMGAAAHTALATSGMVVTLDLTITYLRPITEANSPVTATGRVANMARRTAYVIGDLRDGTGILVAHAVGNFSVISGRSMGNAPVRPINLPSA